MAGEGCKYSHQRTRPAVHPPAPSRPARVPEVLTAPSRRACLAAVAEKKWGRGRGRVSQAGRGRRSSGWVERVSGEGTAPVWWLSHRRRGVEVLTAATPPTPPALALGWHRLRSAVRLRQALILRPEP